MASNMFLAINSQDGGAVQGESLVDSFKNQIEISSWTWGVTQTGSAHSGPGGSTGTATVNDLTMTGVLDKSFPILSQMAGSGVHVKDATLTICKTGGKLQPVLVIKVTGGIVSKVSGSGSIAPDGTSVQLMSVSLNFSQVELDYSPQTIAGQTGPTVKGVINISASSTA
jgi:type VI secretion system secreted protein Hcp